MKRFFWIPFCLLLALFGAALLNAAVSDGFAAQPESIPTSRASARRQAKKRFTSMVILLKI